MIDTLEFGWQAERVGQRELAVLEAAAERHGRPLKLECYSTGDDVFTARYTVDLGPVGQVVVNADGYTRSGRSLAKAHQALVEGRDEKSLSNEILLSAQQVDDTFCIWRVAAERELPFLAGAPVAVTRADVVYQRRVENSAAVCAALRYAMRPTRRGVAWFDNGAGVATGLILRGKSVVHRVYDKGLESGRDEYRNVLRSEEQLRRGAAAMNKIWSESGGFSREGCIDVLNERYLDVAFSDALDVSDLIMQRQDTLALLVLHPELLPLYRSRVQPSVYYRMARRIRERRARAVPADLAVPADAYLDAA